ncbi:MAG: iron chelate uptake ABC transporter family permease subunit, partial [Bacteroidales bacterium]|nr:iron chelate uptake ABC transporter family permease subunit [Bacteroidales bacterium]
MSKRSLIILSVLTLLLFIVNLFWGSVNIPLSDVLDILTGGANSKMAESIVIQSRLPQAITAL